MAILKPERTTVMNGVTVNQYLLKDMYPSGGMDRIRGVTIHNTDWITTAAETTPAEQYTRATLNGNMGDVIVHYYVDNVCAWQNLPHKVHGWHAADGSGDGNMQTIAIECIMDGSGSERSKKSEDNAARLAAALLKQLGFGIDQLFTHQHWYSRKYCPAYILPHWEEFKRKVQGYLGETPSAPAPTEMYRIRKSWDDSKSQIGAYTNLESAKSVCKSGYYVFDEKGNKVYPLEDMKNSTSNISVELRQLRKGMKGKDIEAMQAILIAKGYSCGTYGTDGEFGSSTENAVRSFQTDRKISVDGIVGIKTWSELFK